MRYERKKKLFTQSELAVRVGSENATISRLERGKSNFHIDLLIRIADVLNINAAVLLRNV